MLAELARLLELPWPPAPEAEQPPAEVRPLKDPVWQKVRALYREMGRYLICPEQDIRFYRGGNLQQVDLEAGSLLLNVYLPDEGYNSCLLFTLLTALVEGRLLYLGQPGTGKTSAGLLIGQLFFGLSLGELRRAMIHGHPQLTVADMIGNLQPQELVRGRKSVEPRLILVSPVKIIDELNRIPSKTQAAILSMVADSYAEVFDVLLPYTPGPYYFTANAVDPGTYTIIPPLLDRIDVAVKALSFNAEALDLLPSGEEPVRAEGLALTPEERRAAREQIEALPIDPVALEAMAAVKAHLSNCLRASTEPEHQTKNNVLSQGLVPSSLCPDCQLDTSRALCAQTENGLEPRTLKALKLYGRALAWFRGKDRVEMEDLEQIFPYLTQHKVLPSPFAFRRKEDVVYRADRVNWLRELFVRAYREEQAQAEAWLARHGYHPFRRALEAVRGHGPREEKLAVVLQAVREIGNGYHPAQRDKLVFLLKLVASLREADDGELCQPTSIENRTTYRRQNSPSDEA
ncbi:MAG: hypothetical protein ACUVTQ_05005 [Desulfotomaculales bacterium]